MTDFKIGFVKNEVYKVEAFGNSFKLIDTKGTKVGTLGIGTGTRKSAFENGAHQVTWNTAENQLPSRSAHFLWS